MSEYPDRVRGARDDAGTLVPFCRPDAHRDGLHTMLCLAGVWGYREVGDDWFERIPPDRIVTSGARFVYTGSMYVRPVHRGAHFEDGTEYNGLDALPEGDYHVELIVTRV